MARNYRNGSSGGGGGIAFVDDVVDTDVRIKEIRIRAGSRIDSVQIVYEKANGGTVEKPQHGGNGGRLQVFLLDDDEFITGISGRAGDNVDSLVIQTNKQSSPRYGGNGGRIEFSYNAPEDTEISGFMGRAADRIDAIGVLLRTRRPTSF